MVQHLLAITVFAISFSRCVLRSINGSFPSVELEQIESDHDEPVGLAARLVLQHQSSRPEAPRAICGTCCHADVLIGRN
jgi:hypothetical protein